MADRSRLHINKLDAFSEWLIKDGWKLEEPKGAYEVLRARKDGRKNPLIVYTKLEAKEHLSVMDRDCDVLGAFLKSAKESQKNQTQGDKIRAMSDEELAEFIPYAFWRTTIKRSPFKTESSFQVTQFSSVHTREALILVRYRRNQLRKR